MPFPRWQSSWTSNPYPRERPKRRRRRKRPKPLNSKTQSSPLTASSLSLQEPSTSLAETESHQPGRHLPHPPMLHPPHVPDLLGFRRRSLTVEIVEVVPGLHFRTGLMVGRRLRLDSGRRGKQGTNIRTPHLPNGGSTGLQTTCSMLVLYFFLCHG